MAGSCENGDEPSGPMKAGECLDSFSRPRLRGFSSRTRWYGLLFILLHCSAQCIRRDVILPPLVEQQTDKQMDANWALR
jgi:hypothetical protein